MCSSKYLCSSAGCINIEQYSWLLGILGGRHIVTCVAVYPSVHRPDVFGTSMGPLVFFFLVCCFLIYFLVCVFFHCY